jgi:hypothetical protein
MCVVVASWERLDLSLGGSEFDTRRRHTYESVSVHRNFLLLIFKFESFDA